MTKTKKKILGLALSASMIASCFTGMSISAGAEPTGSTYTVTIPSTLTVENSGWNSIGNISASGTLEDGKKLNITATSLNDFALKSGDNSVSYTFKNASTDTEATISWDFTKEQLTTGATQAIGIDVADYSNKPAGTYSDTVTFTASVEDAVVIHTTLAVGDVIHLGEVLSISTTYFGGGQAIQSSKSPFTLVRANVTDDPFSDTPVTEAEDGQYYVLKGSDGSYCVSIGTPGTSKVAATSTSDGIIVNTLNANNQLYFTTHEPE